MRVEEALVDARRGRWLVMLAGLVALLPDPAAAVPGGSYFFRDFSVTFYPLRLFFAGELREGRVPFWNPYIFEGAFSLPTFYPVDLLHVLVSGPAAVSWLLTLHLPLAAIGAFLLARDLRADSWGAFVAGSVFALGGLSLSSLNLYVFLQALALAPFLILAFRRAARHGGRWTPVASLILAIAISTLAVEFVAQAVVLGLALALAANPTRAGLSRCARAGALGLGLAALPIAVVLGLLGETPRGSGFAREIALANEVHPLSFLQVLVPSLFGSLADPVAAWWGGAFFSKGLPYFLSLYLGPVALALAWAGRSGLSARERNVLLLGAAVGVWYSLGASGGLALALSYIPGFGSFRFPSKALLMPHLAIAILAGLGATRLRTGAGFAAVRNAGMTITGVLLAAIAPLWLLGDAARRFADIEATAFPAVRLAVTQSALGSVWLALFASLLAFLAARARTSPNRVVPLLAALVVFDLVRAGAGMNPQVTPSFYAPLPELAAQRLDQVEGRVFSYGLDQSPSFRQLLAAGGPRLSVASFFINRQMLGPYNNILDRAFAAEATDLTSFVPRARELTALDYDPSAVGGLVPWLRNAGVSRVLSLDPLDHPDLSLLGEVPVVPPLATIRVYGLARPAPPAYVACRVVKVRGIEESLARPYSAGFDLGRDVALEVEAGGGSCGKGTARRTSRAAGLERYETQADGGGYLVVRSSFARGWTARLDGRPVAVWRANGKHLAIPVPPGRHEVVLRYEAPGLGPGLAVSLVSWLVFGVVLIRPRRPEVLARD
jgi:Bacterial membrane protein YfhO